MPASFTRPAAQGFALNYRPDIDGLRAIAVLAVILYHAEIPGFGGGYVGVDVFFVISGYLITQLLAGSAETPLRPRLKDFYLRRARRILPALFATSLIVAVAAAGIFLPWTLARFGRYLAANTRVLDKRHSVGDWRRVLREQRGTHTHRALLVDRDRGAILPLLPVSLCFHL